jgi:pimeloyl-ACP methyl ester carboxylesterase
MTSRKPVAFVLIPGAGGSAWYWHRVVPLLQSEQHEALAVDLPGDDERASLDDYADIVVRAIGTRANVVLVAQSLGGFIAPLVCARSPSVRMLVFLNAMIPLPGERGRDWWANTGAVNARMAAAKRRGYSAKFDQDTYFLHDVPKEVLRDGAAHVREQSESIFEYQCRFDTWPDVPIRVVAGADDRFFPLEFQRRIARDRLQKEVDVLPGGHLVALANPPGVVTLLRTVAGEQE